MQTGTDACHCITPNLSATLSYNTDFASGGRSASVEFHEIPLFPERRAFFLEDSGVFEYGGLMTSSRTRGLSRPALLFFSRRIGRDTLGRTPFFGSQNCRTPR